MRVLIDGLAPAVEGEVIGVEDFDPRSATCNLESIFSVHCDDGAVVEVHGWLVDVIVLHLKDIYLM